jgi:16S rRNA (uracil1498-N3)-methyltransferase
MSSFFFANINGSMAHFDEHEVRHMKVLRCFKGSEIKFTDGKGVLYLGELTSSNTAKILQKLEFQVPSPVDLSLILSPVRWERTKFAVEKAVELGVKQLLFMNAERTTRRKTESKLMKLRFVARDAMKQCGTLYLPSVKDVEEMDFSKVKTRILLDGRASKSFKNVRISESVVIAVGPEGGFTEKEKVFFEAKGFEIVKMGKRTLRTETAVIAALTLVNYMAGIF